MASSGEQVQWEEEEERAMKVNLFQRHRKIQTHLRCSNLDVLMQIFLRLIYIDRRKLGINLQTSFEM